MINFKSNKELHPWAWRYIANATEQQRQEMAVKDTPIRSWLKQEISSYIVTQQEGFISDEDQERIADECLTEFKSRN